MTTTSPPDASSAPAPLTMEQHLADLAESDLSTAAFARERGLPPWKLYNALRQRSGSSSRARKRPSLVPVVLQSATRSNMDPIELVLAGGHRLLIPPGFDADALRLLMGVLSGC